MEANEWVYPPAQYLGVTPVLNQKSSTELLDIQEEVKDFLQLGQYNVNDQNQKIKPGMSLAQVNSQSKVKGRQGHKSKGRFFEDFALDSQASSDDGSYQAQTVDISDDAKVNAFEQTEIVESMNELLSQEPKDAKSNITEGSQPSKNGEGQK